MRTDWVPFSAAALIGGAMALLFGALSLPPSSDLVDALMTLRETKGEWLAASVLFFISAVLLTAGLPSVTVLFGSRGSLLGLWALGIFAVGCVGVAGYSALLFMFRVLVVTDSLQPDAGHRLAGDPSLSIALSAVFGAFYLGETLLAIVLRRARTTPAWIPVVLVAHVLMGPITVLFVPAAWSGYQSFLVAAALVGIGITANGRSADLPRPGR